MTPSSSNRIPKKSSPPPIITVVPSNNDRKGPYLGLEGMISFGRDVNHYATDTDVPTNCDQHLAGALPLSDPSCVRNADSWGSTTSFDGDGEFAIQLGKDLGRWRVELEYFTRNMTGNPTDNTSIDTGGKTNELVALADNLTSLRGTHLSGNLYYDFERPLPFLSFDLYAGIGLGVAKNKVGYSAKWARTPDEDYLASIGRNPNAAGTITWTEDSLKSYHKTYQFMLGAKYWLNSRTLVDGKIRYVGFFDDFEDGKEWDALRSHASTIGPDGDSVVYTKGIDRDQLGYWAVGLGVKHYFGNRNK